jgi:hypothetical protein
VAKPIPLVPPVMNAVFERKRMGEVPLRCEICN